MIAWVLHTAIGCGRQMYDTRLYTEVYNTIVIDTSDRITAITASGVAALCLRCPRFRKIPSPTCLMRLGHCDASGPDGFFGSGLTRLLCGPRIILSCVHIENKSASECRRASRMVNRISFLPPPPMVATIARARQFRPR
jgi:hypothetical protein